MRPPGLIPSRVHPRRASTVAPPSRDTMNAAPRGILDNLHLVHRRVFCQIVSIDGYLRKAIGLYVIEAIGQGHVAVAVAVPIGLSVRSYVDKLREVPFGKYAQESLRKFIPAF